LTPTKTSTIIQEAAKNAIKRIAEMKPFKLEYPLEVKIEFMTELQASESCSKLGFTKVSTTTASFICSNALEINRVINEASRIKDRVFGPIP
jgi:D-aminopeptidase